jgi:signal transduction histidine kinase
MSSDHTTETNRDRHGERAGRRTAEARNPTLTELEVLQAISRAFGSTTDPVEAAEAAVRWVRAAVASDDARVRVFLPRADGQLAPVVSRLEVAEDPSRVSERRRVFEALRHQKVNMAKGQVLVSFPLVSRGEPVGLLEVAAMQSVVEERWDTLEAVASQVAIVFRNIAHTSRLAAGLDGVRDVAGIATEIVRAKTPEQAVRAAVRFCHERFDAPAAGWLARDDPSRLVLVSAQGFGRAGGRDIRSSMRVLRHADLIDDDGRSRAGARFAELAGASSAQTAVTGMAMVAVGGVGDEGRTPLRLVEGLLEDVLDHLAIVSAAERRNQRLDLGIALTAHEVRSPLVGALAIIERVIMDDRGDQDVHTLLARSRDQLEQLSRLVDSLLRWAVAGHPLDLQPSNLESLVREAIELCARETGTDRVTLAPEPDIVVLADADHLRGAVANVLRNALIYSPPDTDVSVALSRTGGLARIEVRDRGPGIPPGERHSIFDPFMRGAASHLARSGNGLGLFIARRVLEAHGGSVWLTSGRSGATFTLELPLVDGGPA